MDKAMLSMAMAALSLQAMSLVKRHTYSCWMKSLRCDDFRHFIEYLSCPQQKEKMLGTALRFKPSTVGCDYLR
ncbi:hypothetical protein BX666DRAFT_2001933 [Dichotomocladium elegans]|nr:hypothetical protein BX666DRAFT_2001933 [Dichotomocladium elegans]